MKKNQSILQRVIHGSELASTPLTAVPLIEVSGFEKVLIENHSAIASYDSQQICIQVKRGNIFVCGHELHLAYMSQEKLVITGIIENIQLIGGSNQ